MGKTYTVDRKVKLSRLHIKDISLTKNQRKEEGETIQKKKKKKKKK